MLLGRAFQIRDDILDHEGSPQEIGKSTKKDIALGRGIVALIGIEKAKITLQNLKENIDECMRLMNNQELRDIADYIITREK